MKDEKSEIECADCLMMLKERGPMVYALKRIYGRSQS